MLFDLRGRGRRRTVKGIYLGLAILMGGGLIIFGIGTGGSGGGLSGLINNNGPSPSSQFSAAEKQAEASVHANPRDISAWAVLARQRYLDAGQGGNYDSTNNAFTSAGKQRLGAATDAWQHYLALNPNNPDPVLAQYMANAYGPNGLNQPANATAVFEIVTQAQPTAANFGQLAELAYLAHQTRKGDLAAEKAVALAPKAQRKSIKTQLDTAKTQAATGGAQSTSAVPTG
jgi:hypothetical protein